MQIKILSISDSQRVDVTKAYYESYGWDVQVYNNDGKFPSYGRNNILEDFYNSNDEWTCICDDDITLSPDRNEVEYFMNNVDKILNKLPSYVSVFWGLNGCVVPYLKIQENPICHQHWVFRRDWNGGKMIFVRNMGKRYYQRTDLTYDEDAEYIYQQMKDGLWTGRCDNIILRERGNTQLFGWNGYSTSHPEVQRLRREAMVGVDEEIVKTHSPDIIFKNGRINRDGLFKKAHPKKTITIPFDHKETVFNSLFKTVEKTA